MPIPHNASTSAKNDKSAEEKKVLSKLLVDESAVIANLAEQVEKVMKVFRIENPSGRIIFESNLDLNDRKRVAALLLEKYFAHRYGLIQDDSLGVSEIADELGKPVTSMSGLVSVLMQDGFVTRLPIRKYRVVYHRIPAIIDMLTERKKNEPNVLETVLGRRAQRG